MSLGLLRKKNKEINKVVLVQIEQIVANRYQPRSVFDETAIRELADSINQNGLLQPIVVRKSVTGYELVAGERRLRACTSLGWKEIPAIIEEFDDRQSAVLALVENLQRKDLNYLEEAVGIARLMEQMNITQQQASELLGKAQSTVANKLRLLKLPEVVRKRLIETGLTERHARVLLKIDDEKEIKAALEYIVSEQLNVEQAEKYIEKKINRPKTIEAVRVFIVKDVRIFLNSIKKAVSVMNQAGIPVSVAQEETDGYLACNIRIPLRHVYGRNTIQEKNARESR